jgi:hypothetical protein
MFRSTLEKIEKEVSGEIAFNFLSEISRFHRIQSSPGIRDAVKFAANRLREFGLDSDVHEYIADGLTYRWSCHMFKEWWCKDAELSLIEPINEATYLSRWSESKLSLVERSFPTPEGGCQAEAVVLEDGLEDEEYSGIDVSGKVVVTKGDVARVYQLAVQRHGALGIIFDGMTTYPPVRREGDLDDAIERGRSGGWSGNEKEPCFCFALTPRRGRWIRKLVKEQNKLGKPVKVSAKVDSKFYAGKIEDATAIIKGDSSEEVVITAHICHPQGYANDNASGCGAAMEAVRILQKLVSNGTLPRPRRSIRLVLMPEMTGTYAWLTENEARIPKMIAGINLDMVGEDQNLCGGPFAVIRTPSSTPSFVNALIEAIFDAIKNEGKGLSDTKVPLGKYTVTPFSTGSDHFIYSDPSVGVPCVGLAQWPDKFYHTSLDTLDKVDKEMLKKASLLTATYAYFIANAGPDNASWLAYEVESRNKRDLVEAIQKKVQEALNRAEVEDDLGNLLIESLDNIKTTIDFKVEVGVKSINAIKKLVKGDNSFERLLEDLALEFRDTGKNELASATRTIVDFAKSHGIELKRGQLKQMSTLERESSDIIPKRRHRGPFSIGLYTHRPYSEKLSQEEKDALWKLEKEHKEVRSMITLAVFWANGERSLLEISDLVALESGHRDLQYLSSYFGFLEKMGLVELTKRSPS